MSIEGKDVNVKWMVLLAAVATILTGGCNSSLNGGVESVEVIVEGNTIFPTELAGRWRADEDGWEFVLAPNGGIVSATISFGRVAVVPGETTTVPTTGGGAGVFEPGPWIVHYAPGSAQLTLEVVMAHVRVAMSDAVIEGSSTDVFAGPVDSVEGVWQTRWTTFTCYTARAPGKPPIDLSTDAVNGETKALTFRKVANR